MKTVKELRKSVSQFTLSPEKARKRLVEIRDLINELLVCNSDAKRMRVYKKLERRLILGWSQFDLLACWSAIANKINE